MKMHPLRAGLLAMMLAAPAVAAEFPLVPPIVGSALENYPAPWPVQYFPLTVDGHAVRMAFQDVAPTSNANGKTAVLLHGKNFFGDYWRDTAQMLAKNGWRVIIVDQLGFGRSSKPEIAYSFFTLAASTKGLLTHLGITKVTVIAHSMGGMVATRFALMYPETVTRLVLEDPIGMEDYHVKVPAATTDELTTATLAETEEGALKFHQGYYPQWKPEYAVWAQLQARAMQGGEGPRVARATALTYQMIYREPVCYEFNLLKCPTLLTVGDKDHAALGKNRVSEEVRATMGQNLELARKVAAQLPPESKLVIYPGIGHIPHLETPEKFHQDLIEFVEK
jgi:pimeloyl-ACP methyl ester carboxylesterase